MKFIDSKINVISDYNEIPFLVLQIMQESLSPYHLSEIANLKLLVADIVIAEQSIYEIFFKSNAGDILKIAMYVKKNNK